MMTRYPDLGDFAIAMLAGNLEGLRDRLAEDLFEDAADLVADLLDITDEYLTHVRPAGGRFNEMGMPADI